MSCPSCAEVGQPLAVVDGVSEYRCRSCGMVYYGPCGCDTQSSPQDGMAQDFEKRTLAEDWMMRPPARQSEIGSSARRYPGC